MHVRLMTPLLSAILCGALSFNFCQTAISQTQPTAASSLNKLPPALRPQGQALINQSGERERARLAEELARKDAAGAMEFLLAVLATDSSHKVRSAIVDRLGRYAHPQVREALGRAVSSDPE